MITFTPELIRQIDFEADADMISAMKAGWRTFSDAIQPYPGNFSGRGIVICAGGVTYMTCAWINISLLRQHGCTLPIEVWYTGNELNEETIAAFGSLGVECRNSNDYTGLEVENLALKPFAILHSRFKEVLYLDADNNCVTDPTVLFDDAQYLEHGTIFWPDFWTTDKNNPIWEIIGSDDFSTIEQESGQILINKEKCWKEMNLCLYFNLNREHYYEILLGDKDTFKFAWMALGTPYNMIPFPVGFCGFDKPGNGFHGLTMVQHDAAGNIIFLHRNWFKWDITRDDEKVWTKIKRFRQGAVNKKFALNYIESGDFRREYFDITGDVEILSFTALFGDFEQRCLDILKELRSLGFYGRFLLYTYFVYFRPGYSQGFTDKIFHHEEELSLTSTSSQ